MSPGIQWNTPNDCHSVRTSQNYFYGNFIDGQEVGYFLYLITSKSST